MTERENKCFKELGGGWDEEHSLVLKWADEHPISPWKDPNVDWMPVDEGEYLVVIKVLGCDTTCWLAHCYHEKNRKSFTSWDSYDDSICIYKKKDVKFWMKIPNYK